MEDTDPMLRQVMLTKVMSFVTLIQSCTEISNNNIITTNDFPEKEIVEHTAHIH